MDSYKKRILLVPLYSLWNYIMYLFVLPVNRIINWKTYNKPDNVINRFRRYYNGKFFGIDVNNKNKDLQNEKNV